MSRELDPQQLKAIIEHIPLGIVLINPAGAIDWVSPGLLNTLHCTESDLVDKTKQSIDKQLKEIFTDGATLHIKANSKHDDICLITVAQKLHNKIGTVHYISDVTSLHELAVQHEDLKIEMEEVTITDAVTGLPNRRALYQSLEPQVSRSRRYDNPLSIIIMKLNDLDKIEHTYGEATTHDLLVSISHMLNDQLRWADTIGRLDNNEFMFVLPETGIEATENLIIKVKQRLMEVLVAKNTDMIQFLEPMFGSAAWKKGDDVGTLMRRARQELTEVSQ